MVFEELIGVFNAVFFPLFSLQPHISLLVISSFLTVLLLVVNRLFVNKNLVKEIKNKMEETRELLTAAQKENRKEDANKHLSEMMKANSQYMKVTFKTLIISIVIISLFLPWLRHTYEVTYKGIPVAKLPFSIPFIGADLNWLYWYIFVSFAVGWVIRKLMEIDYG
ncbi:MAG: EMC3/TMCO1 family protein [Candidatus Aenigmatarchaeota archaeon]